MGKPFGFISKVLGSKTTDQPTTPAKPTQKKAPEYTITPEIREILDLVESQRGKVLFVTGAAGTGKSTLIDILRSETEKNLVVVAPTGVAAINSGGQTIHSFFSASARPTTKTADDKRPEWPCR